MLKIAIVGTGIIGMEHIRAIEQSEQCSLCALCDVNEETLRKLETEYKVPCFTDYHELAEKSDADAVILNLPHFLHCEATVFFLEKGFHVLVEKPMANTVEECDRMIAAAEKSGKKLAVGHVQRFFQANRVVKEVIDSGRLGKLCMFSENRTINYFLPTRPKWFLERDKAGGGIVMNYGAHALDKLFYTLGCREAISLESSLGNVKTTANVEGHAQIYATFPGGVSAVVTFCGYSYSGYEAIYYFTDGALKVSDTVHPFINTGAGWGPVELPKPDTAMQDQIEEFCRYVKGEDADIADAQYGRSVIAAIEKIYQE
ncbi:MAG: Gfo/Idh/MocA family oxidoreductase [Ruminococcaceae bacterium]|nr:Gfo/Idh/MocA family oxidoreductase [Oscillospiraceae bacterium]